ncbi:MAG: cytochrome c-type biogenesis CcmF C-terminal domain-containing protein, partial [Oceanicaulis sp.]
RGVWILGMLGVSAVAGFTLFAMRAGSLGEGDGFEPTSREAFIGANNLLLAACAGVVLVGTLYPLFLDMFGGATISVGPPYFDAAATPLLIAAAVLMPIAPFLPWANGGAKPGLKQMKAAALLIPVAAGAGLFIYAGAPVLAVIGGAVGLWAIAGAIMDALAALPNARARGARLAAAGRALAHAGVGFIALGAAADASRPPDVNTALAPGESLSVAGRVVTLEGVRRADGPNYMADRAEMRVSGADTGRVAPERRFYMAADQTTREVAIRSSITGDLYVSIGEARPREGAPPGYEVRAAFHPLIWALGTGAFLIVLGGALALAGRLRAAAPVRGTTPAAMRAEAAE